MAVDWEANDICNVNINRSKLQLPLLFIYELNNEMVDKTVLYFVSAILVDYDIFQLTKSIMYPAYYDKVPSGNYCCLG